jgi:hypothetical protein
MKLLIRKEKVQENINEIGTGLLEVGPRRSLHNLAPSYSRACERNLVDVLVRRERCSANGAQRRNRVDDTRWESEVAVCECSSEDNASAKDKPPCFNDQFRQFLQDRQILAAGLADGCIAYESSERGDLGRLHDDGAADCESRRHLPCPAMKM